MPDSLEPIHNELLDAAIIAPIALDDHEQHMFVDFEIASLAEHRLGDKTDPRHLDPQRRAHWLAHAVHEGSDFALPKKHEYQICFWLLNEGQRVGTIAFAPPLWGSMTIPSVYCHSLYLLPEMRGRGLGSRIMNTVLRVVSQHGYRLRLTTDWTWQRTVAFYRRLGFWVFMWKRELDLVWTAECPLPEVEVGPTEASLSISLGDSRLTLVRAFRRGDALEIEEISTPALRDERVGRAHSFAKSTLALELAMNGWPLIRSPEKWQETHYADAGSPEALAYKISIWEAQDRARGWIVDTPRIPGLEYPTWDGFVAHWNKQRAEFEATIRQTHS